MALAVDGRERGPQCRSIIGFCQNGEGALRQMDIGDIRPTLCRERERGADAVREVEVKYVITAEEPAAVMAAAAAAGARWGASVSQDDQAYAETGWAFGQPKIGRRFARLRTENGRHLCTIKVPQTGDLDCLETEWTVSDRAAADLRLRTEGFRPTIRIIKTRRIARWGSITLCLDLVEGLGSFLEAEILIDDDQDGPGIQAWLRRRLATLGVALTPVTETYDALLHRNTPGDASTISSAAADTVPR